MSGFKEDAGFTPTTYDDVPWHRKIWALNVFTAVFPLLVLAVLFTGNAYQQNGVKAIPISGKRKWVHIILSLWFTAAAIVSALKR